MVRQVFCVVPFSNDLRDNFVQVANDAVVRNFEDRSIRIFVDGYDAVGCLHTS